jgi:hypothetical protein
VGASATSAAATNPALHFENSQPGITKVCS